MFDRHVLFNLVRRLSKRPFFSVKSMVYRDSIEGVLRSPWLQDFGITTVIDIGANTGQFAGHARKAFPNAAIHSFEPLDACVKILQLKAQKDTNWYIHPFALGSVPEKSELIVNRFSPSSSILKLADTHKEAFPFVQEVKKQTIQVKRLDDVNIRTDPFRTLIKIDVQGYEKKVLLGGKKTIEKSKVIFCEVLYANLYHDQTEFESIHAILRSLGFRFHGIVEQVVHPDSGQPLYADSIFLKI